MSLPKELTTVTSLSKILAALLFILLPLLTLYLGIQIGISQSQKETNVVQTTRNLNIEPTAIENTNPYSCPSIQSYTKEQFLESYQVKKGDTLLSIATSVLKDSSRVSELIALNKDAYPELSLREPFLEVGWLLLLPPKEFIISGADFSSINNLRKIDGYLAEIEERNGLWWIHGGNGRGVVKPDSTTLFLGTSQEDISIGDCLSLITLGTHIYTVQPQ